MRTRTKQPATINHHAESQKRVFDEHNPFYLIEAIDVPVMAIAPDGTIIAANQLALETLNQPLEHLVEHAVWQIFRSDPPHALQNAFSPLDITAFPMQMQFSWQCGDETSCIGEATLRAIIHPDGSQMVLCTITQLIESQNILDNVIAYGVLDNIPQPVALGDENDLIRYGNQAFADLLGRPIEDLIGTSFLNVIVEEERAAIKSRIIERHQGVGDIYETTIHHVDGSLRYIIISASPIIDHAGRYHGSLSFITDLTAQKHAEQELRQTNSELDAFSHTVAHDLKSPLSVLLGFADLLENEITNLDMNDTVEYLRTMGQTTQKMISIVDELLLLSQMRKVDVTLIPVDMEFTVNESLMGLAYLRSQHNAEITVTTEEWPPAFGYPAWIEAVWSNYISNAIKYGGEPPRIEIGATEEGDWIRYWVRDNGEGLTHEQISMLFKPFERLHTERAKGHGVGLTIVQRIMEKLGGRVHVASEPGRGSEFSFLLKRVPQPNANQR